MSNKVYDSYSENSGERSFAGRLQLIAKSWQKLMEPALDHRKKMFELVLSGYFSKGYARTHTVNLMDRGISAIVPFLVEGNPRVLVETKIPQLRPFAYTTQLALNYFIDKLKFADNVLIPAATASMFGAGIARTSFYYDRTISYQDQVIKLGTPNVEVIDDSNYIGDPSAKRHADFSLEGDIYTLPTTYAKDFFAGKDRFGNQLADYITPDAKLLQEYNPRLIADPDFNKEKLSLREYTTFIDLYLYDSNTIVTIMPEGKKPKILREVEYEGPGGGPYDYLGYKFYSDIPIPVPPAWLWHDADVTMNLLVEKMKEQAESQKDVIAYSAEAAEDMERVIDTPNLGTVKVADVNAMQKLSFGGVNPQNYDYVSYIESQFTKQGTNPDVLGGKQSAAPTLGQEQLLFANATRAVNNMYSRFQQFTTSILEKLAWAYWNDPTVYVPVVKEVPGVGSLPVEFSQYAKSGDFNSFVFDIVPYSTQRSSPEIQYQKIMQLMTQWIMPTMNLAATQGQQLDLPLITRILGDYLGVTSINQWYTSAVPDPVVTQMGKGGQASDAYGTTMGNRQANMNRFETTEAPIQQLRNMEGLTSENTTV